MLKVVLIPSAERGRRGRLCKIAAGQKSSGHIYQLGKRVATALRASFICFRAALARYCEPMACGSGTVPLKGKGVPRHGHCDGVLRVLLGVMQVPSRGHHTAVDIIPTMGLWMQSLPVHVDVHIQYPRVVEGWAEARKPFSAAAKRSRKL